MTDQRDPESGDEPTQPIQADRQGAEPAVETPPEPASAPAPDEARWTPEAHEDEAARTAPEGAPDMADGAPEPAADPAPAPADTAPDASSDAPSDAVPVDPAGAPVDETGAGATAEPAQQWPPPAPGTRPMPVVPPGSPADRPRRARPSAWVWPAVAVLSLIVGLIGGVTGSAGYDRWWGDDAGGADDPTSTGRVSEGLEDVELESLPPLEDGGTVAQVAEAVLPSSVQIIAAYGGEDAGASGSGFVLDRQGHVITNNHVVADAAEDDGPIEVVDEDGNHYDAEVVGRSPVYDLAVLYVADGKDLPPASLGRSKALRVGDPVVAIGSPLGLSATVTSGIVSALNRPVTTGSAEDDSSYINAVQTDAAINPGNSGGPLVDRRGQVVGVNSAIATNGGGTVDGEAGNIGVGFAIPVEQVRVTANQILRTGEAQYPVIGAKVRTGGVPDGDGAELDEILDDSPAESAGLKKGDLITHVDGDRVTDGIALIVAIRTHQPGDTIQFTVVRDGKERKVDVVLDGEVG